MGSTKIKDGKFLIYIFFSFKFAINDLKALVYLSHILLTQKTERVLCIVIWYRIFIFLLIFQAIFVRAMWLFADINLLFLEYVGK